MHLPDCRLLKPMFHDMNFISQLCKRSMLLLKVLFSIVGMANCLEMARYEPQISVLVHHNCIFSRALKVLLDLSGTKYEILHPDRNKDLLKFSTKIPKVYLDGKLVGGYVDSLNNWTRIYRSLPEPNVKNLQDPEYVMKKYGKFVECMNFYQTCYP